VGAGGATAGARRSATAGAQGDGGPSFLVMPGLDPGIPTGSAATRRVAGVPRVPMRRTRSRAGDDTSTGRDGATPPIQAGGLILRAEGRARVWLAMAPPVVMPVCQVAAAMFTRVSGMTGRLGGAVGGKASKQALDADAR